MKLNSSYIRKPLFYLFIPVLASGMAGCAKKPPSDAPARVVAVTMKKGDISPKQITVQEGEKVTLKVSTLDVQHGFEVPQLKISEPVNPGGVTEIALDTSKKGTYKVECGIMCGAHHDDMRAEIMVQ